MADTLNISIEDSQPLNITLNETQSLNISLESSSSSTSVSSLSELTDVTITSVADNELLQYNSSTSKWINQTLAEAGIQEALTAGDSIDITAGTIDTIQDIRTTASPTFAALTINGNITVTGTVDGVDVAALKTDVDGFPDELKNLTTAEIQQLENIGTETISATQWGYLGELDQSLIAGASPNFANTNMTGNISVWTNDSGFITSADVVDDTTPQLGGNLDLNGNDITGNGIIDTDINAAGSIGLSVTAHASQSANMTEWRLSDDSVRARITEEGYFSNNRAATPSRVSEGFGEGTSVEGSWNSGFGGDITISSAIFRGTALGYGASVSGNDATAIGYEASAAGSSVVIGSSASTTIASAVVIGSGASVTGGGYLAIGQNSDASGTLAGMALGRDTTASGFGTIAIGDDADATHTGTIVVSTGNSNIASTAANQLIIGGTTWPIDDVYFGKGVAHATPTDISIHGTGGSGTDIDGGDVTIAGGIGTGSGVGGDILFESTVAGATGTTARTLTELARFNQAGGLRITNASTAPSAVANTIQIYSTDLSAGNTMLGLRTEGTPLGAGTPTQDTTIAVEINGTTYYVLASTSAS